MFFFIFIIELGVRGILEEPSEFEPKKACTSLRMTEGVTALKFTFQCEARTSEAREAWNKATLECRRYLNLDTSIFAVEKHNEVSSLVEVVKIHGSWTFQKRGLNTLKARFPWGKPNFLYSTRCTFSL